MGGVLDRLGTVSRALGILAFTAAATGGCARRTQAPARPALSEPRADLRGVRVYLNRFIVDPLGPADDLSAQRALQDRFLDYLEAHSAISEIRIDETGSQTDHMEHPALGVEVTLRLDQTTYRTYILDAVSLFPYALGILTPWWGHVEVIADVVISDGRGIPIRHLQKSASADFSALFFSWFRKAFVEDAYAAAYAEVFDAVARDIAAEAEPFRQAGWWEPDDPASSGAPRVAGQTSPPKSPLPALDLDGRLDLEVTELLNSGPEAFEPPRFSLVWEAPATAYEGTLTSALEVLGGVEVATVYGFANVSSGIENEYGYKQTIASGDASQQGWRIALYGAPTSTGFFIYPTLGYLSQTIDIADFRGAVPAVQAPGAIEISARCSDPLTGSDLDCNEPNVYTLGMQSAYGGLRAGYDFVAGNDIVQLFASASAGVALAEWRRLEAKIFRGTNVNSGWSALQSVAAGGTLGIAFPSAHVAFRLIVDYELYRRFEYEDELPFRGPAFYLEEPTPRYERPVTYVRDARLDSWSLQLATAVVF